MSSALAIAFMASLALAPTTAWAKAENAANVTQDPFGGCLVADANGVYAFDAACEAQVVQRSDRNGNLVLWNYQDHGQLQPGQPVPTSARTAPVSSNIGGGLTCSGTETTTPSGEYRSNCFYNANRN
ncbi:hypothetical protein [Terricaulis silvestris]|uniref:hypothetical protein n=1 Tax=Terricaulis silvestris TaxID=2686094 RepID=UPI00131C6326|nr:hypothetical protein [Terricaulis silvestris]